MSYSVLNLKQDLTGILHGTSLSQVQNLNGVINRAARQVLMDVDPMETKRFTLFTTPIYDEVYDYAVPVDLKGNAIIDIYPQVQRNPSDVFLQKYNQAFDIWKGFTLQEQFTIKFNNGIKTIRINNPAMTTGIQINAADGVSTNGTWAVGGGAASISTNNTNFASGSGSVQFNLSAGQSTGYIENSTMTAVDLSGSENQSSIFFYTYFPTGSSITSVDIRWGTSSSNYWHKSLTTTNEGAAFGNGWNLLRADWSSATKVGSPSSSAINYIRITYTYDSTLQTGVLLDSVTSRMGIFLGVEYYSKYLFRNTSTGAFQETVLDDSDLINLDTDTYNLLLYKTAELAVQQQQGLDAMFYDGNFLSQAYQQNLLMYKAKYKSEKQKPQSTYYKKPNPSYNRLLGGNWYNRP